MVTDPSDLAGDVDPGALAVHMATHAEEPDQSLPTAGNLAAVIQAIATCQTALTDTTRYDHLQTNKEFICNDLDSFSSRVTEVEQRVSTVDDTVRDHSMDLHILKIKVKSLEALAEDSENRNQRNNLRILGLPEGAEGIDSTAFTEQLLTILLPNAWFSPFFYGGESASHTCY